MTNGPVQAAGQPADGPGDSPEQEPDQTSRTSDKRGAPKRSAWHLVAPTRNGPAQESYAAKRRQPREWTIQTSEQDFFHDMHLFQDITQDDFEWSTEARIVSAFLSYSMAAKRLVTRLGLANTHETA